MRSLLIIATTALLSACASQSTAPVAPAPEPVAAKPMPAVAPAPVAAAPEKKAPQCWSADESTFMNVGTKTKISGVAVECVATSDGKAAQWAGKKH